MHENWPKTFLLPTEEHARKNSKAPSTSHIDMVEGMRSDPVIANGVTDDDPFNKIPDGFLQRVKPTQLVPHLAKFRVEAKPEELQKKMAEMMQTTAYMMAAAQRPGKKVMMDFVLLHNVTLAVHYPGIMSQSWLTDAEKARLLEAKARVDAVMYAGCKSPALHAGRIRQYVPTHPEHGWNELFHRSIIYRDEGHAAKLVRALYSMEGVGGVAQGLPLTKGDFLKIAHMTMDSIEMAVSPGGCKPPPARAQEVVKNFDVGGEMVVGNMTRWVFYGGLEKAWDFKPDLEVGA